LLSRTSRTREQKGPPPKLQKDISAESANKPNSSYLQGYLLRFPTPPAFSSQGEAGIKLSTGRASK
jgi:hypothetical protein